MTPEKILYEPPSPPTAAAKAGESVDGHFAVDLSVPKGLGGPGGEGTNPEQLFAAGYAACFLGAVKLVARTSRIVLPDDVSITAKVGIGPVPVGYALAVELVASMPGIERAVAEEIVAGAHERCPYSNATARQCRCQADGRLMGFSRARQNYDGVVLAVPVTVPYQRYSIESAHWWIGKALRRWPMVPGSATAILTDFRSRASPWVRIRRLR